MRGELNMQERKRAEKKADSIWDAETKQLREAYDERVSKLIAHAGIDPHVKMQWLDDAIQAVDKLIDQAGECDE